MSTTGLREITPAREQRLLRRARKYTESNPALALETIHSLLDAGVSSPEVYELQGVVLLGLGCGTFAAVAAENALRAGGDTARMQTLLLKSHLAAHNRRPATSLIPKLLEYGDLSYSLKADIATAAQALHQYEIADRLYNEILAGRPDDTEALANKGFACQKRGMMEQARECYGQVIRINPNLANSYKLLASVGRQTPADNFLELISGAVSQFTPGTEDHAKVAYALGKTCEDLGKHAAAFDSYQAGAGSMLSVTPYDSYVMAQSFTLVKNFFRRRRDTAATGDQLDTGRTPPLFILGMPRTGSTLLDRILSSHPDIVSMGELGCFKEAMRVMTGFVGASGVRRHFYGHAGEEVDLARLGDWYVDVAGPDGFPGRYFIDKYPLNFMDLGLIAAAIPDALFINTLRHPLDTCWSNFKQLFALGFYNYSYSLHDCAEYYLLYRDLMDYWHQLIPGRILDVHYEDVVADTEGQARRVLEFLGLEWNAACLSFYESSAPVDTASLSQVRQPVYKSAVGHWQNYREQLKPAIEVFEKAGINISGDGGAVRTDSVS